MEETATTKQNTTTQSKTVTPKATGQNTTKPKPKSGAKVMTPLNKKNSSGKPSIAMFIDVDNVGISRENLLEILFFLNGKYQIKLCNLYGFSEETLPGIKDIATDYNLTTIGKMKFKAAGKNCLDSRLLVDAYECALTNKNCLDTIFVWCYPCDLADLFEKIVNLGVATATIDDRAFDCKNKFVSQTFKIYSPYHFDIDDSMYGQVQNLSQNAVKTDTTPESTPTPNTQSQTPPESKPMSGPAPESTSSSASNQKPALGIDDTLDGKPVPVLPRREIPERSPRPTEKPDSDGGVTPLGASDDNPINGLVKPGESIVDAISRKLNIPRASSNQTMPNESSHSEYEAYDEAESISNNDSDKVSLMEIMEKAGFTKFGDDDDENYEDTIGDL